MSRNKPQFESRFRNENPAARQAAETTQFTPSFDSPHRRGAARPGEGSISDRQWKAIAPLLPAEPARGRHRTTDVRSVVEAIHYRWQTGCPWRQLPQKFPPWPTVYTYFRAWLRDGTLRSLREVLKPPRPSEISDPNRAA
ncbi:transposase [Stratiformator vulcanicus]|uniref:Insertion element IS402-like domain-containing protein n=1 Tax=Stratiformator vulcanicus TaxID=2527980 RepID=A0A517QYG4_9PLAN|nr:transposase [Stratiformator vulcanicus]QDT36699.1 hypothetical protein Pan189_10610 [Stratiformator vulcanicus]